MTRKWYTKLKAINFLACCWKFPCLGRFGSGVLC